LLGYEYADAYVDDDANVDEYVDDDVYEHEDEINR